MQSPIDFVLVLRRPDFAPSSETPRGYVGQAVLENCLAHIWAAPNLSTTRTSSDLYGTNKILRDLSPFFIISRPSSYCSRGSLWVTTPSVGIRPSAIASITNGYW